MMVTNKLTYYSKHLLRRKFSECLLAIQSLTYNSHADANYITDILLNPMFWIADNFAGYLGKVFVFCVIILVTSVVFIGYWIGLPYWWQRNHVVAVWLVLIGNWLLWNVVFHYYKGVVTAPGAPPQGALIVEAASICKKCITPKPPRTHHCSVCDKCILAMDHHCPWLNNCVGFYNARHFFLCMVYMVAGVLFLIMAGFNIGYAVLWTGELIDSSVDTVDLEGHPVRMNQTGHFVPIRNIPEYDSVSLPRIHNLPQPVIDEAQIIANDPVKRKAVIYLAFLSISVFLALGVLIVMHGKQINRGETSVEYHINNAERKRLGKSFRNPYDFGPKKNWMLFLGLNRGRSVFFHVLLPSGHKPTGTGLRWHTIYSDSNDWP